MKRRKKIMLAILLLMVIGFASISTVLIINGGANLLGNTSDFDVYFSKAESNDGIAEILDDRKHITFTSKDLIKENDKAILDYEVVNNSANYDANVEISCSLTNEASNEYLEIKSVPESITIPAQDKETGKIEAKVKKSYFEEEGLAIGFECTLDAKATERGNLPEEDKNAVTITIEENGETRTISRTYGKTLGSISPKEREGYEFIEWQDEEGNPINENTKVTKPIKMVAKYRIVGLYQLLKTNASSASVNFSVRSGTSGTHGIYTTSENGEPVYYYRGKVDNNIIFADKCWKIIRTTDTKGIKLIYNGVPSSEGECNSTGEASQVTKLNWNPTYNDNAYVGYMFGINNTGNSTSKEQAQTNTYPSEMKTYLEDTWYAQNMTSYTKYLEDTVFCNDRTTKAYDSTLIGSTSYSSYGALGYGTNPTLYGPAFRAWYYTTTPAPSLACSQANDKFTTSTSKGNGKLKYPVGLITLDEAVFAGYNTYQSNTSDYKDDNYLQTGQTFWTFSPVFMYTYGSAIVGYVNSAGSVDYFGVNYTYGVRPVVSLAHGTQVEASGNGTVDNPYKVKLAN